MINHLNFINLMMTIRADYKFLSPSLTMQLVILITSSDIFDIVASGGSLAVFFSFSLTFVSMMSVLLGLITTFTQCALLFLFAVSILKNHAPQLPRCIHLWSSSLAGCITIVHHGDYFSLCKTQTVPPFHLLFGHDK